MTVMPTFDGMPVIEDPVLPIDPTPVVDIGRWVRHRFAELYTNFEEWAGPVGPKPGESTTMLVVDGRLHVAPGIYAQLLDRVRQNDDRLERIAERRAERDAAEAAEAEPEAVQEPPPPAWLQRSMCTSKVRHKTREAALGAALQRLRRTPVIRFYACPLCDGFHLTSRAKPPPEVAALEEAGS